MIAKDLIRIDRFFYFLLIKSEEEKMRHVQKLPTNKKSIFFVQSSWNLVEMINSWSNYFTKFHEDWTKNVDFSLVANFQRVLFFFLRLYLLVYILRWKSLWRFCQFVRKHWTFWTGRNMSLPTIVPYICKRIIVVHSMTLRSYCHIVCSNAFPEIPKSKKDILFRNLIL